MPSSSPSDEIRSVRVRSTRKNTTSDTAEIATTQVRLPMNWAFNWSMPPL